MISKLILVVQDEDAIKDLIRFALSPYGYEIVEASNVAEAEKLILLRAPQLIILDGVMEYANLLKSRSATRDIPIMMLITKSDDIHNLKKLNVADAFVLKPFSPRALHKQIKALFKQTLSTQPEKIIRFQSLCLNLSKQILTTANKVIALTPIEFKLLNYFISHQGKILTREQLLKHVWRVNKYVSERAVDAHVRRLRLRLASCSYHLHLKTVHGVGYQFSDC